MANNSGNINVEKGKSWLPKFLTDLFEGTDENIGAHLDRNAPPALGRNLTRVLNNAPPTSALRAAAPEFVPAAARGLNPAAPEFVPGAAQGGRRGRKLRRSIRRRKTGRKSRRVHRRNKH